MWYIDLLLTIEEPDVNSTVDYLAILGGPKDVANNFSISERSVCDLEMLLSRDVCQGNEELTAGESIEVS